MKKKQSNISLILKFMKGSTHLFVFSMAATLAVSLFELIYPQIIRFMTDSVIGDKPLDDTSVAGKLISSTLGVEYLRENIWAIALVVVLFAVVIGLFKYLAGFMNGAASERLTENTRNILFDKIEHLPYSWHTSNPTGDIIQRCTSDVETIKRFLSEQLTSFVSTVMLIILSVCFLIEINTTIALIAGISVPIVVGFSFCFHKLIHKGFTKCDENEGVLSSIVQENLTGVRVVRAFGRESAEIDKFTRQNHKYTDTWMYLCRVLAGFWATNDIISCVQVMIVVLTGVYLCVGGTITAGDFIAAVTYNALLTWPVRRLGRMISEMSKAQVALGRLGYIINSASEAESEDALLADLSGDIELKNVSFSYDGNKKILDNVSVTIKSGSTLGIIGGTGSGKSTLVSLLCRLYELPEECGEILISGVDIRKLSARSVRDNIGIVLQEPFLFSRNIEENISISKEDSTHDDVMEVAEISCLDRAISEFKNGYDTLVGERGVTLSGGQKQRVAIARILLRGTKVIIFDDSLSAVDAETDALIRREIARKLKDTTVIIISHRISSIMHADNIIVLDEGKVIESGTHDELVRAGGTYRRIFDIQTSGEFEGEEAAV